MAVVLLVSGCVSKVPFKSEVPLENAALVYVYTTSEIGLNETHREVAYKIAFNGKKTNGLIKSDEYMAFHLKAGNVTLSAIRGDVEEQSIKLDIKAGNTYYIKIKNISDSFAKFELLTLLPDGAIKEITKTVDANSKKTIEKEIEEMSIFADKKPSEQKAEQKTKVTQESTAEQVSSSNMDELEKAHKLKEKGILSEEEFKTLKTRLISK